MTRTVTPAIAELMARPQWVVWRYEMRGDKPTKVPYTPDGRRADSTDPATWSPYTVAHAAAPDYDGSGFCVQGSGFCGVDLDDCLDPETLTLTSWARAIVDRLRSYTEITPSGHGLRMWVKGTLPPGGRRKGAIEMYCHGRWWRNRSSRWGKERQHQRVIAFCFTQGLE